MKLQFWFGGFRYIPILSAGLLALGWFLARRFDRREDTGPEQKEPAASRWKSLSASTIVLAAAMIMYAWTASRSIDVPGFEYDELIQIVPAFAFVHGPLASGVVWLPGTQVGIFGHALPLMTMAYIGAVKTMAFVPIAWKFGITTASVRYFTIALGAIALLTTFGFLRSLMGCQVAAVATWLLATDSSFIFYTRTDWGPVVMGMLIKGAALWLLTIWWKTRRNVYWLFGCFALGIGVYDKANFVWVIGGISLACLVVAPRELWTRVTLKSVICGALGFAAGVLPLLWFNVVWPLQTLATQKQLELSQQATMPGGGALGHLWQRLHVLARLLDGQAGDPNWVVHPASITNWHVISAALFVAFLVIVGRCFISSTRPGQGPSAFIALSGLLILMAAALTPLGYQYWHVISVYPFPHIVLAYGLMTFAGFVSGLAKGGKSKTIMQVSLTAILTLALVLVNLVSTRAIFRALETTGGHGAWSDSINPLAEYLLQEPDQPVIALDWGIKFPLIGISQGRLRTDDYDRFNNPTGSAQAFEEAFAVPANRYVLHAQAATAMHPAREHFFEQIERKGYEATLQRTFCTRDGVPEFEVYTVQGFSQPGNLEPVQH